MIVLFFYIVMFLIQITVCRSIPRYLCSDLSVFDGPDFTDRIHFSVFVTDRIKTYMSENDERVFPDRFHP
jgi:hypothetical protein